MSDLLSVIPKSELSPLEYREWITDVEKKMLALPGAFDRHDDDDHLKHTFTPGLYTRQIFMPKDLLVVTRIHMFEHPFVISQGDVSVYDGKSIVRLRAPFQGVTPPGTKRFIYVHEDTIWTTFHVTDKKTFEEIDQDGVVTCSTFEQFDRLISGVLQ